MTEARNIVRARLDEEGHAVRQAETALTNARAARQTAILEAIAAGMTIREIADVLRMSFQAISQISRAEPYAHRLEESAAFEICCPRCRALAGEPCRGMQDSRRAKPHPERRDTRDAQHALERRKAAAAR